jgi:hypothetical protein
MGDKMKKLNKVKVDNLIRITRKVYEDSDNDFIPELIKTKRDLEDNKVSWRLFDLISDMARYSHSKNATYKQIYNALKAFGYEVTI